MAKELQKYIPKQTRGKEVNGGGKFGDLNEQTRVFGPINQRKRGG